jgi:2-oxoglutarate ferredoxin oxidoreductase subunit alpha
MSQLKNVSGVNDFVVKFANVNGSGSSSANHMFAKALFRMGLPVSARNIFPSNIQGLPTWYEVRINEAGFVGRRGDSCDLMCSVNPESMPNDVKEVEPGGYFLFDDTKPLDLRLIRNDINYIGVPLTAITNTEYTDPRLRQLFKNVIYVGAIAALIDIEFEVLASLVSDQFKGKEKLIKPNIHALELGYNYAKENYSCPLDIRLERRDLVKDMIFVDGNTACGLGAVYGGATVCAWYPITPSTSVAEAYQKYAEQLRIDPETGKKNFASVQAEDELSAMGMVIGANWNGARAFTATSGPGISLMSEFLGLAYFAEVPVVLIDVQRAGPSTGMPTKTQQSDVLPAAYASHGDTKHILLFPSDPKDCFDQTAQAFDIAERVQTPVIMLTDLDLGMNDWISEPLEWDDDYRYDRGKIVTAEQLEAGEEFGRYRDVDGDGMTYRTYPGTHPERGAFFTRGTSRDENAIYTENGDIYVENMERLVKKFRSALEYTPKPVITERGNDKTYGVIHFGTTRASLEEAMVRVADQGYELDDLRLQSFPFHDSVKDFIEAHDYVMVIEQNRDGQMRTLLVNELEIDPKKLIPVLHYNGTPINATYISETILGHVGEEKIQPIRRASGGQNNVQAGN